jgi:L-rhamnose-H+ transport protein
MGGESLANPTLGIIIFTLGGLAGAVFYLPFKKVVKWSWESYWMIYAVVGLLLVPWVLALITSPNVFSVLKASPRGEIWYCVLCGAAWGFGGLTWGLMIRYLGVGLGLAIGAGLVSACGTVVPMVIKGTIGQLVRPGAGVVSFVAVLVSLAGIVSVGMAGMSKERELSEEQKKRSVAEFNFRKGILVAVFSGVMSSALGFGLQGGATIEKLALTTAPATPVTWKGMPVLALALLGGFAVNFLWCVLLNIKNKSARDYVRLKGPMLARNFAFAALAGIIWCSQFICFKTGQPAMGKTDYVGWAVLMASQILFGSLLGIALGEWRKTGGRTRAWLAAGIILLVCSSVVAGYSSRLAQRQAATVPVAASVGGSSALYNQRDDFLGAGRGFSRAEPGTCSGAVRAPEALLVPRATGQLDQ